MIEIFHRDLRIARPPMRPYCVPFTKSGTITIWARSAEEAAKGMPHGFDVDIAAVVPVESCARTAMARVRDAVGVPCLLYVFLVISFGSWFCRTTGLDYRWILASVIPAVACAFWYYTSRNP